MRPSTVELAPPPFETPAARRRRRMARFRPPFRTDIARLTLNWPPVEDLADSFPGLLFALATGYGSAAQREEALCAVEAGRPLKEVAASLCLPLWLRRLPPEAFAQSLPALPLDAEFAAPLLPRIPESVREASVWLDRLLLALKLIGRDFALWAAREPRFLPPATCEDELQWMLAWAWASRTPRTPAHALIRVAWTPALGWKKAHDEVAIWRKRVDLVAALAGPARDPWFAGGTALGYEFVHLDSPEAFIAESAAMENCLDQYAAHLSYGRIRVFSIRREGRPVADVELSLRPDEMTMPSISQLRGLRNRRASPAVWQAVHAWLGAQPFRPLASTPTSPTASREAMRTLWAPYVTTVEALDLGPRLLTHLSGIGSRRPRARPDRNRILPPRRAAPAAPDGSADG